MTMLYTIKEAAEILKVHPSTIRRMIQDGRLPTRIVGTGKRKVHHRITSLTQEDMKQPKQKRREYQGEFL